MAIFESNRINKGNDVRVVPERVPFLTFPKKTIAFVIVSTAIAVTARLAENYMSEREKVKDGTVALTNYGWIDENHAIPEGPKKLISLVLGSTNGRVFYEQKAEKVLGGITLHLKAGGNFIFDKDASPEERKSIAYKIFKDITAQFERTQLFTLNPSVGDLNGDNMSFWLALTGKTFQEGIDYLQLKKAPTTYAKTHFQKNVFYIPQDSEGSALKERTGLQKLENMDTQVRVEQGYYGAIAVKEIAGHKMQLKFIDEVSRDTILK